MPKPELYVVYTGTEKIADEISFKDTYFDGTAPIDVIVKVLRMPDKDTLYGQYIAFSKVYDGQRKLHKNKIECISNTLDICIREGYLREFFEQHRQEVVTMLSTLFDEQAQREQYDIAVKEESKAEGIAQGVAQGIVQGIDVGMAKVVQGLYKFEKNIKKLSERVCLPEPEVERLLTIDVGVV